MSREVASAVRLPVDVDLGDLLRDIEAAYRRAEKSEPGERADIVTYETLSSTVELRAARALSDGSGTAVTVPDRSSMTSGLFVRDQDSVTVALCLPLEEGTRVSPPRGRAAPDPAASVPVRDDIRGRQLVFERFRAQLDSAIAHPGKDRVSALSPSGVHNRVLTEVLREYVQRQGKPPVSVPVVYRDGSRASTDFPLHCLDLTNADPPSDDQARAAGIQILRLALLSIRHTEMDAVVDGAWLRNAEVSKPRTAAQTDDYVYHQSVKQLNDLTSDGLQKLRLYLFQTGLETAVVGCFRAVVDFLARHPGGLEVIPMFYAKNPPGDADAGDFAGYERGDIWATTGGSQ